MKTHGLQSLGVQLREDLARHEQVDRTTEARTRRQLLARVAGKNRREPRIFYVVGGGLAAAAALTLAMWLRPAAEQEPLRFWVEERVGKVDDWVTARDAEQSLRFSDGSSVIVSPHTTARVMQVSAEGAQLTLERGHIDAHVVHREASRWQVAAGPFVVHVTGTRFRVNWDPQTETLAVKVTEGRVEVTGGGQPQHELTAGSVLELSASVDVKSAIAPATTPSDSAAPDSSALTLTREDEELHTRRVVAEHRPDFRELSTAGRYKEALAAVEQLGFASQCNSLSARDLLLVASTARLAGRSDRARDAYLAARRRFPGSSEAGISAFSLGRLASDSGHATDAIGWFKRYLSEEPSGPLAREAAGRLIELYRQNGGRAQARTAADSYLEKYPTGPHAALARSVLAAP